MSYLIGVHKHVSHEAVNSLFLTLSVSESKMSVFVNMCNVWITIYLSERGLVHCIWVIAKLYLTYQITYMYDACSVLGSLPSWPPDFLNSSIVGLLLLFFYYCYSFFFAFWFCNKYFLLLKDMWYGLIKPTTWSHNKMGFSSQAAP